MPVSSSVPFSEATTAPIDGCEVVPDIASIATSTASAPAFAHSTIEITPVPAVSCVCTWMGRSGNSARIEEIRRRALCGVSRPAISLMFRMWMPSFTSFST